jgi:amino acid transporter
MYTIVVSVVIGVIIILGILFGCQERLDEILRENSDATANFFLIVSNNRTNLAIGMILIVFSVTFLSGFSGMTVTSRMAYAMSRDGALPMSQSLKVINPKTKSPDRIIFMVFIVESLLCFLPLMSTTAFTAIT